MTSLFSKHGEGEMWATKVHPIETEKNGEIVEKPKFKDEIREFGGSVTLHGIRYITDFDLHFLRRLGWLVGLAILGSYLCYEIGVSIWKFWEHPISTVITMNYVSNITFPAITICNYNLFKSNIVTPTEALMVSSMFNVNTKERVPVDWAGYERSIGRPLDVEGFVLNTAHRMEDMLLKCTWRSSEKCTAANFTRIITDWGVCYTFNNNPEKALQVKRPGSTNGLAMMINIEQDLYTYGENTAAGLKVLLHPPGQFPLVKELGFSVSPGYETDVSVRYNSITNLPHPYPSNCSAKQLVYSRQYTVSLCRYECKVTYVTKICGCKDVRYQVRLSLRKSKTVARRKYDWKLLSTYSNLQKQYTIEVLNRFQPLENIGETATEKYERLITAHTHATDKTVPVKKKARDYRICSPQEQIDCIYPAEANFTALNINCDCHVSCESFIYEGRLSTSYWPALHVEREFEHAFNVSHEYGRANLLDLTVYFEELSFQQIKQTPAYDAQSLQSDIGGMMGLLCGMSIVTVAEFFDFICGVLVARCRRRREPKVQVSPA
ncbi:acid-sensing ion channel 4-A-like [Amphiura filiformis]|uniref:acid-sensing ion channel 4-A-like n=1 Tax=Amphiura filiformis TaxID=82378 RepID=UPI003B219F49